MWWPRAPHPPEPRLSLQHGCPVAQHPSCPQRLLQPWRCNPSYLCIGEAVWIKSYACSNSRCYSRLFWQDQRETTWTFTMAHQREGDLCALLSCSWDICCWSWKRADLPCQHAKVVAPDQNKCRAPPWKSLVWICVRERRGPEALRTFVCLFVFSNILIWINVCKPLWHL